jgi:endonuclease/exonuclease/phosphatase family metal-dependent hydrolase
MMNRTAIMPESEISSINEPGIQFGGAVAARSELSNRSSLILSTFNIRYAVGSRLISGSLLRRLGLTGHSRRPDVINRNIEKAAGFLSNGVHIPRPDIVALQEADVGTARAARQDIAGVLSGRLSMAYAHAPSMVPPWHDPASKQWYLDFEERIATGDPGDTGIAILANTTFDKVQRIELPWMDCPSRPRVAMAATFEFGGSKVIVINAHIDPHADIRGQLEQHRAIVEIADGNRLPTVYAGDFNTLSAASRSAMRELLEGNGFSTPMPDRVATWRAGLIRLHTDWIFTRDLEIRRWGVGKPLRVSDHWPVWAEIQLRRDPENL